MPLNVSSRGVHVPAATRSCSHGDLTYEGGYVGTAVKQQGYTIATARANINVIAVSEPFFLITTGVVEVAAIGGATFGEEVYITTATGVVGLGAPSTGQVKVGRIVALPGTYGCPTGLMWVNLDAKDTL
jgi:hypothetical protein